MSRLLRASEIAPVFGVDARTIGRWADAGSFPRSLRTPGNQRRWKSEEAAEKARAGGFVVPEGWETSASVAA